jgi:hypothetical protein
MLVREVDSGTALTALVATPFFFFGGNGAILDGDAPGPEDVDVTAGQVVLLASQGIGASGNALDVDAGILAALTLAGDINVADVGDGLTIGTVAGFVGVQNTSGVLGDDITVAATAPGGNLTVDAAVVTAGSGAVTLSAANDVSFTAIGQVTAVLGDVLIDADGDISMTAGSQISTTGGMVELLAVEDIIIAQITTTSGSVLADADGGIMMGAGSLINSTAGGMVELLAGADIVVTQITTTTGNVDVDAGGGIMMADGSQIVSTSGAIDLLADASITVGQVQTSTIVTMSAGGAIIDGGDTGGADIVAAQTALSAASGIGAGNALETQVSLLSARNTTTGDLVITNSAPGVPLLLTVGDVGGLIGIENTAVGGAIDVTSFGSMNVNSTVDSAGALTLTTENVLGLPSHLTLNGQVTASGAIELDAGGNLNLNDTLADNDVEGASVVGRAGGLVVFAPNVIVRSSTGAVADKLPFVTAIDTNIDNLPIVTATVTLGRAGEENLIVTVDFDGQDVQTESFDIGALAPITETFEGLVVAQVAQITITVTVIDDPNITFFEGGTEVARPPDVFISGPVFNTGLITSLPRAEPLPLPLPEPDAPATSAAEVTQILQGNNFDDLTAPPDAPPAGDERIIIIEKVDADGVVEKDRNGADIQRRILGEEAEEILADPSKLFQKLKSGRFQIWLKDGAEAERNLIWDVILRDGRPESGAEGTQRLPTETPAEAMPEAPAPDGGEAAADMSEADDGSPPDTGEVEANEGAAAREAGSSASDGESPGAAAAAAGLLLPGALRRMSRYGRQMACTVCAGVAALLRSITP